MRASLTWSTQLGNLSICTFSWAGKAGLQSRMFIDKRMIFMCFHRWEPNNEALRISDRDPPSTTGRTCLKSPPNKIGFPPNNREPFLGSSVERISRRERSNASKQYLWLMGASSHIINEALVTRPASMVPLPIPQVLLSWMSRGILNLEWAVCPPGRSRDATPQEATARTIWSCDLRVAKIAFHKNVFPVPPCPDTKYANGCRLYTAWIT